MLFCFSRILCHRCQDGKKVRTKVKGRCSVMNMVIEECAERRRVEVKADAPSTYRPPKETLTEKKMRKQSIRDHQRVDVLFCMFSYYLLLIN